MNKKRRSVVRSLAMAPALFATQHLTASTQKDALVGPRVQYSVNAYSFNSQLRSGEMTFFDMMEFAAEIGLNAVDLTGYYFPTYPEIPQKSDLFLLKRRALELGLNISWTGIRNDFVNPDADSRKADREMISRWLSVSSNLGASILRIFDGNHSHEGYTREAVKKWLVEEYKICAAYGKEHGVILGFQNHNEFLLHSDEIIDLLKRVDSEWFGLILDIGSLSATNPYDEIEKLAPYASYWFIKEQISPDGIKKNADMKKLARIIKNQGYQGYVSFESLTDGDPKLIVSSMYNSFRAEYEKL